MRFGSFSLLLAAAACDAGTVPNTVDVSGHWVFTETFQDPAHSISCADTGSYEITQVGDQFSGRYGQRGVCRTPTGVVDNTDSGVVQNGRVIGHTVRFMVTANCDYEGSASGIPATALAGRGACVLQDVNRKLRFSGNWQATR